MNIPSEAIYNFLLDKDQIIDIIGDNFYFDKFPQNSDKESNVSYPCILMNIINNIHSLLFGSSKEIFIIQFSLFDYDFSNLLDLYKKFTKACDGAAITISGYYIGKMIRNTSSFLKEEDIWQIICTYELEFFKED